MSDNAEVRASLISEYNNASTEEEKENVKAKIMATFNEREQAIFGNVDKMAMMIAHLDNTKRALENRYDMMKVMCEMFGFPIGEKVEAGNNTVQLNNYINILDTEKLSEMCNTNTVIADRVNLVIEAKREKIDITSLTMTDVKGMFGKNVPTATKRQLKAIVKPKA